MKISKFLLCVFTIACAPFVYATPTVTTGACNTSGTCATGINGLSVDGSTYNVKFLSGQNYDTLFASSDPTFLGQQSKADDALAAIAVALGSTYAGLGQYSAASAQEELAVPYAKFGTISNEYAAAYDLYYQNQWYSEPDMNFDVRNDSNPPNTVFLSVFTKVADPTQTPEPGSLALLSIAGLSLALSQRRRRQDLL